MIKTKEDLVGRYAALADKEVFELFMQKCEEFGVKWCSGYEPRGNIFGDAVLFGGCFGKVLTHGTVAKFDSDNYKRLTLADFKPTKTRTEYKPVTLRDYEALQEFHADKEFYHKPPHARNYNLVRNVQTLIQANVGGYLYTKEEKEEKVEVTWRDVVNGYDKDGDSFDDNCYEVNFRYQGTEKDFLRMCHEVAELTANQLKGK